MRRIDTIIFHHSAARQVSPLIIDEWHRLRGFCWTQDRTVQLRHIGYHYGIDTDGSTWTGRPLAVIGAHAKGRNSHSVGVLIQGDFSKWAPTAQQLARCVRLYHDLCRALRRNLTVGWHRPHLLAILDSGPFGGAWERLNPCPGSLLNRHELSRELQAARPY